METRPAGLPAVLTIAGFDPSSGEIRRFVERKLVEENVFWPDALLQINPSYKQAATVAELAAFGHLLQITAEIFREGRDHRHCSSNGGSGIQVVCTPARQPGRWGQDF